MTITTMLGALYQELYPDWRRVDRDFRTNGNTAGMATESLWLNLATTAALGREQVAARAAMPLFANGVAP